MACMWFTVLVVLVYTETSGAQVQGDLRLVDSSGAAGGSGGRVEIYYSGEWGTICDNLPDASFENRYEADVICLQLGYDVAVAHGNDLGFPAGLSSQHIWLTFLSCPSNGTNVLRDCDHLFQNYLNCTHSDDVMVQCLGKWSGYPSSSSFHADNGDLRLAQGNFTSSSFTAGRLEVFLDGEWGTICDDGFGSVEADLACRQLGYSSALQYGNNLGFGFGANSLPIFLDGVDCAASDSRIIDCHYDTLNVVYCAHSEDIMINCGTSVVPTIDPAVANSDIVLGDLRLVADNFTSSSLSAGRLEIFIKGEWGTICDNKFGSVEADVACRQLGYSSALQYGHNLGYGSGSSSQEVWLNFISCTVLDTKIFECYHNEISAPNIHNCLHSQDVMVICSTVSTTEPTLTTISNTVDVIVGSVFGVVILITIVVVAVVIVCVCWRAVRRGSSSVVYHRVTSTPYPVASDDTPAAGYPV